MYKLVDNVEEYRVHAAICRKPLDVAIDGLRKKLQCKVDLQPIGNQKLILMLKNQKGTYYFDYHIVLTKMPMKIEPRELRSFIDGAIQEYCKARKDTIRKNRADHLRYTFTTVKGERFVLNVEILCCTPSKYKRLVYNKEKRSYGWSTMVGKCRDIRTRIHRVQKYNVEEELRQIYLAKKNASYQKGEETLSLPLLKQACVEVMHLVHRKQFLKNKELE